MKDHDFVRLVAFRGFRKLERRPPLMVRDLLSVYWSNLISCLWYNSRGGWRLTWIAGTGMWACDRQGRSWWLFRHFDIGCSRQVWTGPKRMYCRRSMLRGSTDFERKLRRISHCSGRIGRRAFYIADALMSKGFAGKCRGGNFGWENWLCGEEALYWKFAW